MPTALLYFQIILSVLITAAILLQAQGSGLGTTWSGGGETYHTKRGVEKVLLYATVVMITLFVSSSLLLIVL